MWGHVFYKRKLSAAAFLHMSLSAATTAVIFIADMGVWGGCLRASPKTHPGKFF